MLAWEHSLNFDSDMKYWNTYLENTPKQIHWAQTPHTSGAVEFSFDENISHRIKEFTIQKQITPFVFFLHVVQSVIYRFCKESDFATVTSFM